MQATTKSHPQRPTFTARFLSTELWTKIFRYILVPALNTRNPRDIYSLMKLLRASRSTKALITSLPEFQYLRNAYLRMRYTPFTPDQKLFRVYKYTGDQYSTKAICVSLLPSEAGTHSHFTIDQTFDEEISRLLYNLRSHYTDFFATDPDSIEDPIPETESSDRLIQACKDLISTQHPHDPTIRALTSYLQDLDHTSRKYASQKALLHALPSLPKSQHTVMIDSYSHCSCNGTNTVLGCDGETTWNRVSCTWKGSAEYLYSLCRDWRDLAFPGRRVSRDDYDFEQTRLLYENYLVWYEGGPYQEQIYAPPTRDDYY
ncbi:hypothetical protein HK097_003438 [Rhizophlyctis rosea]|uniref:Uncharacterized protein n=1 Tax=Rhizophlyctis rosea TaxID=64517 RepID=A0AAD5X0L9_9FUNG|nr:hypothetical protein HK097_003438 [Rhizophlyctis rosea]